MADQQSIVTLNIGSQRIAMAVFEASKKGTLNLASYAATTILADPATEISHLPQVQLAIRELLERLHLKDPEVCYALSGHAVLNRFVKLPPLEEEGIDELVRFEAQQTFPFPIDEVVWDWQVIPNSGLEKEVILVAIKTEALDEISDMIDETGIKTEFVDSAPTALYNSLRYNYPDLNESTLLLDVGAKSSNLIYVDGDKFYTRSINIGGASLTSAIAKDYDVSFAEAENTKVKSGLVSLGGGHNDQLDEATAALGAVIRNALGRLNAQISQTTTIFRSQHQGTAPKKILLAGGGSNLPYFKEFLEEKLSVPVEYFNGLRQVSVGKGVDVEVAQAEAHLFGELTGLAVRHADLPAALKIDLVPTAVESQRDIDRRKPLLITAALVLLAGAAIWTGLKIADAGKAEARLEELEKKENSLIGPSKGIAQVAKDQTELLDRLSQYSALEDSRKTFVTILRNVSAGMAHDKVWVTDFRPLTAYVAPPGEPVEATNVVEPGFPNAAYGTSGLNQTVLTREGETASDAKIEAISISGYWRTSSQDVYTLLNNLRADENTVFRFTVGEGEDEVELKDSQIVRQLATEAEVGSYAAPFELILPLRNPLPLK